MCGGTVNTFFVNNKLCGSVNCVVAKPTKHFSFGNPNKVIATKLTYNWRNYANNSFHFMQELNWIFRPLCLHLTYKYFILCRARARIYQTFVFMLNCKLNYVIAEFVKFDEIVFFPRLLSFHFFLSFLSSARRKIQTKHKMKMPL